MVKNEEENTIKYEKFVYIIFLFFICFDFRLNWPMRCVSVKVDQMHPMRIWDCHEVHRHHHEMVDIMWSTVKSIARMSDDISIIVHWAC